MSEQTLRPGLWPRLREWLHRAQDARLPVRTSS